MKTRVSLLLCALFLILHSSTQGQSTERYSSNAPVIIPKALEHKLNSGSLFMQLIDKRRSRQQGIMTQQTMTMQVVVYFSIYPTQEQIRELEKRGLTCYLNTWTPPMDNHPFGFFLASASIDNINGVLALDFVKKLDTAERMNVPMNNNAARSVKADAAWAKGWTGKGVKVAILDSGLDTTYYAEDFAPNSFAGDYSYYPNIDNDVRNRTTGHGTHVAGTAVGTGWLSRANTINGGGSYKGIAPEASLLFFKIGDDSLGGASDAALIGALNDAVVFYKAKVVNLSYGGYGTYHDGSEPTEQKADWCYSQGASVFFSAGNSADDNTHFMGTVAPNSITEFIKVVVSGADGVKTRPSFNLVWYDGLGTRNGLKLHYYNSQGTEITAINRAPVTESQRGTESEFTSVQQVAPAGSSNYYLKVENTSNVPQVYHIYEDYTEHPYAVGSITFESGNSDYTLGSPSNADHVISVAAYTSRPSWLSSQGNTTRFYQTLDGIAGYSSRGPRVDGFLKPNISAPGVAIISLRDRDVYKTVNNLWVDNDGVAGGSADYYVMGGTSMAAPICTGAAALLLHKYPSLTPQQVYDSLLQHAKRDAYTGAVPNTTWGAGKLDLSFLSGIVPASDGWVETQPPGWEGKAIPGLAMNAQGHVFVVVGHPWSPDTARLFRSTDDGATWTLVKSEVSLYPLVMMKNGWLFTAGCPQGMIHRSVDNGNTWSQYGTKKDWTCLAVTPDDSVIAGTYGQGVFLGSDGGTSWININAGLPTDAKVVAVSAGPNHLYSLTITDGNGLVRLYRCTRGNYLWSRSDTGIDTTKNVNACAVTPDGTVFAAVYDRIYRSTDQGTSWQQITILNDYLQSLYAYSNSLIFVGTVNGGIYRSTDKGVTWSSFSDGLTLLNSAGMAHSTNGKMYSVSHRQYVYKRMIGAAPAKITLQEPANTSTSVSIPALLKWQSENTATSYWLQVSTVQDFSSLMIDLQGMNQREWLANTLQPAQQYFWRVCAMNNAGLGPWSDVWSFTATANPPNAPGLIAPAHQSTNTPLNVSLQWSSSDGADSYHVQVSTSNAFGATIIDQSGLTATSLQATNLSNGVTYFWRVRASNNNGVSIWSEVWSFTTVIIAPTAPILLSPANGATGVPTSPLCSWNSSPGATSYHLQVATDPLFQSIVFDQGNLTSTTKQVTGLIANTKYYWRVNATNSAGTSGWSAEWSFMTSVGLPAIPTLSSPSDKSMNIPVNSTLTWNPSNGAESYTVHVGVDMNFMPPLIFSQSGIVNTLQALTGLPNNTTLYWRVNASNSAGASGWSDVWSFTTVVSAPPAPTLLAPANNAINIPINSTLTWIATPTAESYRVQVATNPAFSPTVFDQSSLTSTSQALTNLAPNTVHYWHVNATNAGGTSDWSSVWRFTTSPQTSIYDGKVPTSVVLDQNYPNPFAQSTAIGYRLLASGHVRLEVFDLFGRKVATLVDDEREAGEHVVRFDADGVISGICLYRLQAKNIILNKKLVITR